MNANVPKIIQFYIEFKYYNDQFGIFYNNFLNAFQFRTYTYYGFPLTNS